MAVMVFMGHLDRLLTHAALLLLPVRLLINNDYFQKRRVDLAQDKQFVEAYCRRAAAGFAALESVATEIEAVATTIGAALQQDGKILLCGNGGSAADAQHIAAELMGRFKAERRALAAIALTTDTSALTAIANDYDFSDVFARQVEGLGCSGDVLIAISTSGNSENILKAARAAKARGLTVVAMTGEEGGMLAPIGDYALKVPSGETSHIQEMHIAVGHMICALVESGL